MTRTPGQIRLGIGIGITAATLICGLLMPAEEPVRLSFPVEAKTSGQVER